MARLVVAFLVLYQTFVPRYCTRLLPVYDIRTDEKFSFPEDFLKLVLDYQIRENKGAYAFYVPEHLDEEGYIINENGQLVPFKIYKKGGSRLHPRNCRGGFHKRLIEEPVKGGLEDLYELKVYKRKYKPNDVNQDTKSSERKGEKTMYNSKKLQNEQLQYGSQIYDDSLLNVFPSLKSKYLDDDIDGIHYSETDMETLKNMNEANQLLKDLSEGLEHVADPPPIQSEHHIRAELEEYPAYELWGDYNINYDDNDDMKDAYSPSQSVDLYAFRRRK